MDDQRRQHDLILVATAVVMLLLGGVGVAALLRPKPIVTLDDAVATVLDHHGIGYERVTTSRAHPATGIYYAYAFDVRVQIGSGSVLGTLDCSPSKSACFVDLRRLGIQYERLPTLEHDTRWEWLAWAQRVLRSLVS